MLEIRHFLEDLEKHLVASHMPSVLKVLVIVGIEHEDSDGTFQCYTENENHLRSERQQNHVWQHWWILWSLIKISSCCLHFWLCKEFVLIAWISVSFTLWTTHEMQLEDYHSEYNTPKEGKKKKAQALALHFHWGYPVGFNDLYNLSALKWTLP